VPVFPEHERDAIGPDQVRAASDDFVHGAGV
jgi:hypothetical protein